MVLIQSRRISSISKRISETPNSKSDSIQFKAKIQYITVYLSDVGKMVRMQWWAYLLMLMVYICYLLIGAAVFQKLESPFEEKRCMNAKAKVKDKKEEFGNEVRS